MFFKIGVDGIYVVKNELFFRPRKPNFALVPQFLQGGLAGNAKLFHGFLPGNPFIFLDALFFFDSVNHFFYKGIKSFVFETYDLHKKIQRNKYTFFC